MQARCGPEAAVRSGWRSGQAVAIPQGLKNDARKVLGQWAKRPAMGERGNPFVTTAAYRL